MAKKKESFVPAMRNDWSPERSEARRKELFPRVPPPTLSDLKATRGMNDQQKEAYYKRTRKDHEKN